jgi:hypothetical protein
MDNVTEIQGPYARQFTGLDLSSSVGAVAPDKSPVFHNCEIAPDGAVVRRGGTGLVATVSNVASSYWSTSIKTRGGSEYYVNVTQGGISYALVTDGEPYAPTYVAGGLKPNVWTKPLTSVRFIPLTNPFDRVLILTGNHPIVQLSFIERTQAFVCQSTGATSTFVSTSSPSDSKMWLDTTASNYIVTNATGTHIPLQTKGIAFQFTTNFAGGWVLNSLYDFTMRQITWQWWAESVQWEGADFQQNVSRLNVTEADQSVAVPSRLTTDLNPVYRNSQELMIQAYDRAAYGSSLYSRTSLPSTSDQYAFSSGGRYAASGTTTPSPISPYFITFGVRQTAGTIGLVVFNRLRELRFAGGIGVSANNLAVFINEDACGLDPTAYVATTLLNFQVQSESFNGTDRVITYLTAAQASTTAQYISFFGDRLRMPFDAVVDITSTEASNQFGGGTKFYYKSGLASLDGSFVRAQGIGQYSDYAYRRYHAEGSYANGRLFLVNPNGYPDELLVSGSFDEATPGEFFQYYQITDALKGDPYDPFTVSVSTLSRERITAIQQWQDNIFVFTNLQTHAIKSEGPLTSENFQTTVVSSYGAFNSNCVVVGNLTILYMNSFGVFDLLSRSTNADYGAFERSSPVRPLFAAIGTASTDKYHWLHHNTNTNKLHVGLAAANSVRDTTTHLVLDLTYNSWSTVSSFEAFSMTAPVQLFNKTCYLARYDEAATVAILATDMPFYLDFAYTAPIASFPRVVTLPWYSQNVTTDKHFVFPLPAPVAPGVLQYSIISSQVVNGNVWVPSPMAQATRTLTVRNTLGDNVLTAQFLNGNNTNLGPYALARADLPHTLVPSIVNSGQSSPTTVSMTTVNGPGNVSLSPGNLDHCIGCTYTSVYASPVLNLEQLGTLKRLKRLHLQFDPSIVEGLAYQGNPVTRITNVATVSYSVPTTGQFSTLTENLLDESSFNTPPAIPVVARATYEMSIPLQGTGTEYQFWLSSVGAEAFKLASYELAVQPQENKKYIRR